MEGLCWFDCTGDTTNHALILFQSLDVLTKTMPYDMSVQTANMLEPGIRSDAVQEERKGLEADKGVQTLWTMLKLTC
jgi:hypothetical protein